MKHWQQYTSEEQLEILDITAGAKALPRLAIEKDWWVVMVLKALSKTQYANLMSFKGGTSLSKGWNLIERFSEDIDITIKREDRFAISGTSNNQLAKVRRAARHYIVRELPQELDEALKTIGVRDFSIEPEIERIKDDGTTYELRADTHPSVIFVNYKSVVPETSSYLLPRIKIEISCLSMDEPVETKSLHSFISESVNEAEDVSVDFRTVVPTRTFLEKIFLLHEEFQKDKPRTLRMSRHHYDLVRIMDTKFGVDALSDMGLYADIAKHRSIYNHIPNVDYSLHSPATINIIPPAEVLSDWKNDYNSLVEHFLYYNKNQLSFESVIERIRELQTRLNALGRLCSTD